MSGIENYCTKMVNKWSINEINKKAKTKKQL